MIEFPWNDRWNYESWFYFDEGSFSGEPDEGGLKIRTYKSVGRDSEGRLVLHHQLYHDQNNWRDFTARTYEISPEEYTWLLDRAISQKTVEEERRKDYLELASSNERRNWNIHFNMIVYMDERYALIQERERVCFISKGKCYRLSCHPYEPCTYIHLGKGIFISVHNAFDPYNVVEAFSRGKSVTSVSGKVYDRKTFCETLEFMIDNYRDADISYLEGAITVQKMKELDISSPEKAVELSTLGVRTISDSFSHSRSRNERVMYTPDGKVYLKIKNR